MRKWRTESVETVFRHPLLELQDRQLVADSGEGRRKAIVLDTPDWVNVIPLTREGRVLLIRQWRYGIEGFTLEIPGGVVEPDEDPATTAARELLEETGYRAGSVQKIGTVHPNPAIHNNRTFTYVAEDLEQIGPPEGDGEEEIEVTSAALDEIPGLVRDGTITHSLVIAAFYFYGSVVGHEDLNQG
jgi:8-oxo-dGTP pyrophosphatase MutT (NUDIX family)